jgi:hypothetical protein
MNERVTPMVIRTRLNGGNYLNRIPLKHLEQNSTCLISTQLGNGGKIKQVELIQLVRKIS